MITELKERPVLVILCITYFALAYVLAIYFYNAGLFGVYDILFDADPNSNIVSFAHGENGRFSRAHPLLEIVSLPIGFLSYILINLGLNIELATLKEVLALSIAPLTSSLTLYFVYKILHAYQVNLTNRILLTLLFGVSFSNLLFAIVPETYPISCLLITLLVHEYVAVIESKKMPQPMKLYALAFLLPGITITNTCIFFIVYFLLLMQTNGGFVRSFLRAGVVSFCGIVLALIVHKLSLIAFDVGSGPEGKLDWISYWLKDSLYWVQLNVVNLFSASLNAFAAAFVYTKEFDSCKQALCTGLTMIRYKSDFLWLSAVIVFWGWLAYLAWLNFNSERWKSIYLVSLPIIAFNFCLHAVFGYEVFLYAQHWFAALFLLMIPFLHDKPWINAALCGLLLTVNLNFIFSVPSRLLGV